MFVPSHREWEKWDKVGQKSAFWRPAVTIFVTIVKDQGVKHMFTPSLRVYHTCQEGFLFFFELPRSSNCKLKSSFESACPYLYLDNRVLVDQ